MCHDLLFKRLQLQSSRSSGTRAFYDQILIFYQSAMFTVKAVPWTREGEMLFFWKGCEPTPHPYMPAPSLPPRKISLLKSHEEEAQLYLLPRQD